MLYTTSMKRLIIFLSIVLFSVSLSAEAFNLFSWTASKSDIVNNLCSKGWTYKEDADKSVIKFYPKDNTVTFKDEPVTQVSFIFNKQNIVIAQNLTIDGNYNASTAFFTAMCIATDDKAKLIDCDISNKDGVAVYSYFAELQDYNSTYMVLCSDDKTMLGIMYTILSY